MIRKFKHKITGYIATETNSEKNYKVSEPQNFTIPKWIIEDSEDWEEIKEFPKIISYRAKYIGPDVSYHFKHVIESILKCNRYAYFASDVKYKYENGPYYTDFEIYQVAISETETFTLGDRVTYNYRANYAPWIIDNFFIRTDGKIIARSKSNSICEIVSEIKKYKEPLLVTEDGKEIYGGDDLYYLNKINGVRGDYYWDGTHQFDHKEYFQENPDKDKFYWFASKQKLELFWKELEQNKPKFSVKNIEDALKYAEETYSWNTTKDLFKQKLGL